MKYQIRQLTLGGILDQAILIVKDEMGLFFWLVAFTIIPLQAVVSYFALSLQQEGMTQENLQTVFIPLMVVGIVIGYPLNTLATAAVISAVTRIYHSQQTTIGRSFRAAFGRLIPLLLTTMLMMLAIMLGMFLCLIPGILFAFWFAFAQMVTVLEMKSGPAALQRSRDLMKGNMASAFALGIVVWVIVASISMLANVIPQIHLKVLATALCQGLATVFAIAVSVVFYFSCRCKLENYDLLVLAGNIEASATDAVVPADKVPSGEINLSSNENSAEN